MLWKHKGNFKEQSEENIFSYFSLKFIQYLISHVHDGLLSMYQ